MKQLITKSRAVSMLICLLGILGTTTVHAQVDAVYGWAKGYGTTSSDYNTGIATDASGNVYTVGNFNGSITALGLTSNINNLDVVITKHNAAGQLQWAKSIGGTGADVGYGIAVDSSSNVYITGHFVGTVDFNPSTATENLTSSSVNNDIFLAKYDANGNYVWAKAIGGTGDDDGYGITLDANNNVYLTGYFSSTADFDPSVSTANLTSAGSNDVFIAKYDTNGTYTWAKAMGGTLADYGQGIAVDTSNNVYITGSFQGTADFDPSASTTNLTSAGGQDIFMAKYNASGNYVWTKSMGGNAVYGDIGLGIALDASSNVYITGNFSGTVDFDPSAATANLPGDLSQNIFMAKYNASGNYIWAKAIGSDRNDLGNGIALDASSNVYITGVFAGTVDFDPSAGVANLTSTSFKNYIFMAKYNASGNYVWAKTMGGDSAYGAGGNDIAVDASSNVYITGNFSVTADFDPSAATANLIAVGQLDLFVAKYSQSGLCTPTFTQVAAICSGASLSALPTTSNNAVTGTWSPALNNTASTTYTFTPLAGSCDNTATMTITVNTTAAPTAVAQTFCTSATVANLVATGTAIKWYAALTGGTVLGSTTALVTGTTYYATQTVGTCESTRTAVAVTIGAQTTPTFTAVASICSGATLAALPTPSTNGITGTWSPALNNTITTLYTFTPTVGLCANTTTMTITVNPIVTPVFTQITPINSGASLSALPTTSTNGINGTWSPALNNTNTTTYSFVPNTGQCSALTTMTITVNQNVPTISSFTPTNGCSGTSVTIIGANFTGA
ncbi:MAG: putative adhesin, partial [Bacteroidota bacterium]